MKLDSRSIPGFLASPDPEIRAVLLYGPDEGKVRERGADLARKIVPDLNDPFRIAEFTGGKGLDVWVETQREPDFMTMVPAMAPRVRMVLIAGRAAQPVFPVGPFYVKGLTLTGFAMFNAPADEQRACAGGLGDVFGAGRKVVGSAPVGASPPSPGAGSGMRGVVCCAVVV
mgnify:CR=1 FL=1